MLVSIRSPDKGARQRARLHRGASLCGWGIEQTPNVWLSVNSKGVELAIVVRLAD
jgi:hypothetical protein